MDLAWYLLLFILGAVGGFLGGLLGVGGGLIYVVILQYAFSKYVHDSYEITRFILANSIFSTIFAGLSSATRQVVKKMFFLREVLAVGIPSALVSALISYLIKQGDWYNKTLFLSCFEVLLAITIVRTLMAAYKNKRASDNDAPIRYVKRPLWMYASTGAFAGIISPLTGLGGGLIIVPSLSNRFKIPVKQAVNVSVASITLSAFANAGVYLLGSPKTVLSQPHTGYVVWSTVLPMIAGVLLAAYFGTMLAQKIKNHVIQRLFALLLGIIFMKTLIFDLLF